MNLKSKRVLFVGFRGKETHVASVKAAGVIPFLLIEEKEARQEYSLLFEKVFAVKDLFDWSNVVTALKNYKFDGILTRYEDFVELTSALSEYFKTPGIKFENAQKFRNKYLMRKAFAEAKAPSADFELISSIEDAQSFLKKHSFPFILKQTSGIHSKFVAKVNSVQELKKTFSDFRKQLPKSNDNLQRKLKKYPQKVCAPDPLKNFLLEECLTGMELTIDAFVVNGKIFFTPICRYVLAEEIGIDDAYLPIRIMPFDLTSEEKKYIFDVVKQGLQALGANYCATHTEVFYDREKGEARIIEIAARGGGFRAEMYKNSCDGGDYDLAVVQATLGVSPKLSKKNQNCASVVEIFSPKNGKLKKIDYNILKKSKNISHLTINKKIGEKVGLARDGNSFVLKFLLKTKNYESAKKQSIQFLNKIRKTIVVK